MKRKKDTRYLVRSIFLFLAALIINIALGHLVQYVFQWPLFLDSIGTILIGALLGPLAGAATGAISNIAWYMILGDQSILPFSITAAFIGWAAGYAASRGAFQKLGRSVLSGLLVGIGAALISAPISAYIFGGFTGGGSDYLTRYLTAVRRRIDRLPHAVEADRERMQRVQAVQRAYDQLLTGLAPVRAAAADVRDIAWQIEELRVSLWAQQLGTPRPVSEQRIYRAIDGVRDRP